MLAAAAGIVAGPFVLQYRSGAPALLSTVFPDLQGQPRRLADWTGNTLVCNFWATWCAPCREEIPVLQEIRAEYAARKVEIVGIGVDQLGKIVEFAEKLNIQYPLLVGDIRALGLLSELGNKASALPYTVVLTPAGRIAFTKLGQVSRAELRGVLEGILG